MFLVLDEISIVFTYTRTEACHGKGVYFLRVGDKPIRLDLGSTEELMYGEISNNPIEGLQSCITDLFHPCMRGQSVDWGKCGKDDKEDFLKNLSKFKSEMITIMDSLSTSINLAASNEKLADFISSSASPSEIVKDPINLVHIRAAESLMTEWINQIDKYVIGLVRSRPGENDGPRTELDLWRNRMNQIESIESQLHSSPDCKFVIAVLSALNRASTSSLSLELEKEKLTVTVVMLKQWKQTEISLHESLNESRENVKYLSSLDKYLEPMYSGTPDEITEIVPALMNAFHMMNSISKYYSGSGERMTLLISKITNQMITNSMQFISGNVGDVWWEDGRENRISLIDRMKACIALNTKYQSEYRIAAFSIPPLNEISLFGKFDLFCRRLTKLIDLFSIISQLDDLAGRKIDGMSEIVEGFISLRESFRSKRHNFLDYHDNKFDRDYVEFIRGIGQVDIGLSAFVSSSLSNVGRVNIDGALELVEKYKRIFQSRSQVIKTLEEESLKIFANFGNELLRIQDLYEKYKSNPPIGRNMPPVAGNISWSRHLLKRIEDPMKNFQDSGLLATASSKATSSTRNIVKLYNRLARTLIEFETVWYQAWMNSIDEAKSGLRVNVIVRHPDDDMRLHVNMDQEVLQLIRESKILDQLGLEIPAGARMVLLQEKRHKKHYSELGFILREYARILEEVPDTVKQLLKPHMDNLERIMDPALYTLTWTSLNLDSFIENFWSELKRFSSLVTTINDYIDNRIERQIGVVGECLLVDIKSLMAETGAPAAHEKFIERRANMLINKSIEIENTVSDLLGLIVNYHLGDTTSPTGGVELLPHAELVKFKAHYNWSLYSAILQCTRRSLLLLRRLLAAACSDPRAVITLIRVGLEFDGCGVRQVPSMNDIERDIFQIGVSILKCSKMIEAWDNTVVFKQSGNVLTRMGSTRSISAASSSGGSRRPIGTFYDRVVQDKEILISLLMLKGTFENLRRQMDTFIDQYSEWSWLWSGRTTTVYKACVAAELPGGDSYSDTCKKYELKLKELSGLKERLQVASSQRVGSLLVTNEILLKDLRELIDSRIRGFEKELHSRAKLALENASEKMNQTVKKLNRTVEDIESLGFVMNTLNELRSWESDIETNELLPIQQMYGVLDMFSIGGIIDKDEQDMRSMLVMNWNRLLELGQKKQGELSLKQNQFKTELTETIKAFQIDVVEFRKQFEEKGPMVVGIEPKEAVERLRRFKEEFDIRARKEAIYRLGENLFGLNYQLYPLLDATKEELGFLSQLYDLYVLVLDTIRGWKEMVWSSVVGGGTEIDSMKSQVEIFLTRCKKMPKQLKDWKAFSDMKKAIDDFNEVLPLLIELSKKSMQPRHWEQVRIVTGMRQSPDSLSAGGHSFSLETLVLGSLIEADLLHVKDEILDITDSADKQVLIEKKLFEIESVWKINMLDFGNWKSREIACILSGGRVVELQEQLEESVMTLNTIQAMRHSTPFREKISHLLTSLSDTIDTLERWIKVQMIWTGLESVFTSGDIAKQMPIEAKKFANLDKEWIRVMSKCSEIRIVVLCCQNDMLKQLLPALLVGLEGCQRSLESYLEGKRNKFPRFYFVSDPVLLKILSQGSDPQNVQEDLEKLFDSISRLEFDRSDKRKIVKIKGIVGNAEEVLDLSSPVIANGNIEDWLTSLELEMQKSVRRECKFAAIQCSSVMGGTSIKEFADRFIAQVALLGIQQIWTSDFQDALVRVGRDKDRQIMATVNRKFSQILSDLVAICLTDLGSKMNRTKYETLVTIHVHQRDLFNDIWKKVKEHRIKDEGDFEWLKQTRFYWKSDSDHAIVSIADVDFTYSYEYLGVKERLVITPLTDRCYLTLSQALGICYGGAPAGPAGTGKTETVKDLSRTLGIACVVTNCSDQHRSRDMASIFKGTCSGGVWSCFDEFNRIELEVLSVVAMQIEAITFAKKQHMKTFMFPGERVPIKLSPSCGYFITMNPGYAGRQQLPNNLAILFRSVSMMVPDREIIMKVKLASVGYSQMDVLGKKFNILYQLCEQQLSKQRHYDFGLRNILSVLRTAGGVKRTEAPDADEEMIFMRTVRDMNLSKLVADDVPLFLALLKDLFPKQTDPPKKIYKDIEEGVDEYMKSHGLVNCDSWKLKVIQLYETSLVRHGLMLVGPSLCGKTEIINVLSSVLTDHCSNPHRVVTINPKAITDSQMYGVKDPLSEEWTPGVFASIWQKYNNRSLKYTTWIICDGPVDAIWIENLNSVLDDNKILTLANNDRIAMTDNCRILFEVENLNNASPATVSRAGIIFVSSSDLGWKPLLDGWIKKRSAASPAESPIQYIKLLIEKLIVTPDLVGWMMQNMANRCSMTVNESMMIVKFLNLLDGQLSGGGVAIIPGSSYINRVVVFSLVWAFGGLLDTSEDRLVFNTKISEIIKSSASGMESPIAVPKWSSEGPTFFEYWPGSSQASAGSWELWKPEEWIAPKKLSFSSLLIPTMDSIRAQYLMRTIAKCNRSRSPVSYKSSLLLGSSGTAKTSTVQMYLSKLPVELTVTKRINFSSATTPFGFQKSIEMEIERKTGKTFCPPNGKKMVLFIDDMSMPMVNKWGDQVTLEIVRQLVESGGFYFLEKDKRGDFKSIEDIEYIGSMMNPGGGRNDIPNRIKSKFFSFAMVMPNITVVDSIYGSILRARFSQSLTTAAFTTELIPKLTGGTIAVWEKVKRSLLPTPQRFHYVFNMRDLSRVFQGILDAPLDVVTYGGKSTLISLWRHECTRVFTDKLCRDMDKDLVGKIVNEVGIVKFGAASDKELNSASWWCDFQRDPVPPSDGSDDEPVAPKIYEPVISIAAVRKRAYEYLWEYNEHYPSRAMKLVLFDDALGHLMKIVRIIQQKRGSAMLVGVGGSGKQSLTRLGAFICNRCRCFQISITKSYNENAFFDDLKNLFIDCGQKNNPVTFILTDAEIKSEEFLEHMNSFMATGEVSGLFQKDERESMCAEVRGDFVRDRPGIDDSPANLYQYLIDRLRDNLHVVYCFSPVGQKFSVRAQKFPAIFSNANINWFLPWPTDALMSVAETFLENFEMAADNGGIRAALFAVLGAAHACVNDISYEYGQVMRRKVYVTPKNFLCLIELYQKLYTEKFSEVSELERSVNVGLAKLNEAASDVERLKIDLREEEKNLKVAEESTNNLLFRVQSESVKAETQAAEVGRKKDSCLTRKAQIEIEQAEAEKDLQAALPFLHEAENAVKSITAKDITELKTLKQPSDIIRLVFDGLLILQQKRICDVKMEVKNINKQQINFIHDSYDEIAKTVLTDIRFLPDLMEFSESQKDYINDETCELLEPYLRLENFNPAVAKKASGACEGLCKWVGAMVQYHEAAKIVKPKMDYLKVQGGKLDAAMKELAEAEKELASAMEKVSELNASFKEAMENKTSLENRANMTRRKMDQAEKLITGLASEKIRWTEDAKNFSEKKRKLIGDVALCSVFVTYCGAFNSEYREKLVKEKFIPELSNRNVPFTENLDIVKFLVDQATLGEWALEGLPSDDLSIQNAIIVARSARYPLIIDPQGQAVGWIKNREEKRIKVSPNQCVTTLGNPRLKDQVEFTMSEGLALLIENVGNEVDPLLDPVLDRSVIKKGKNLYINVSDQNMDFNPKFSLYLTSRYPNPHFSPELSARCAVIDFTVTMRGLEQQLLGRVLGTEQRALEQSLTALMEDVTANTKALQELDKQLLHRLSNSSGNLLDDLELIEVLGNTKATAKEVEKKLRDAEEKKIEINLKREQYRPVAARGSVMYFCIKDMTLVSNPITLQPTGWMYNISLLQFMDQFDFSISNSEKCQQTSKRVDRIVDFLTYHVYRYVNRGLFERDKLLFKLMITLRILQQGSKIGTSDVSLFLRAGSALDIKSEPANAFSKWMTDKVWLNLLALERHGGGFAYLTAEIQKNEPEWKKWFDHNEPEKYQLPGSLDDRIITASGEFVAPFFKTTLVRSLREDRTTIVSEQFVGDRIGEKFTKPVTDSIESIWAESTCRKPILYLLSAGSDPTGMIDEIAKKKKRFPTDKVSMGEGQEAIALEKIKAGFLTGNWVVLQNSHLGLGFMERLEDLISKTGGVDEDFRLWITCEVTDKFPIGLLQMSIKVTLEPPMGLQAGLSRTYSTSVSQETLDRVDNDVWRKLVYVIAYMHSIVQERRKFGPIGWCVPYEFNSSDMEASLLFLEKHLSATVMVNQSLSWSTIQYMVSEVQYGGRITDDLDRELFNTYANRWLAESALRSGFNFLGPQQGMISDNADGYTLPVEEGFDIAIYKTFIEKIPNVDSPAIFGLHKNADLSYRQLEASMLLSTISETQPKEGGSNSAGGASRDEMVKEKSKELLCRMPKDFIDEQVRVQVAAKHKGPPGTSDKGFQAPLNIFMFQEIQRIQRVIGIVRNNLSNLVMAIDGTVVMTPELMDDLNMIFDARIPRSWTHDASGAEISWLTPSLGSWFTGLIDRVAQLSNWLENGRQAMKGYWLTGFLNPQGFLTAVRQEVTRQHKKDSWALDDVVTHTEVVGYDIERIRDVPEEGQNIYGLYLEGAKWNRVEGRLDESDPKKLFSQMPVIHITAVTAREKKAKTDDGPHGPYECPVYKYSKRTDKYLIFRMNLKSNEDPDHWKLRGVSMLCSTE